MEGLLKRLFISSRSDYKHGNRRQFLFLIGRFLKKIFSSKAASPNEVNFGSRQHMLCPMPTILCTIVVSDMLYI
jgi:hypothetical protein